MSEMSKAVREQITAALVAKKMPAKKAMLARKVRHQADLFAQHLFDAMGEDNLADFQVCFNELLVIVWRAEHAIQHKE